MIVNAISPLGARLLDTNRARATAGASRTRKFMSIRATHGAAYNAAIVDEIETDDPAASAQRSGASPAIEPQPDSLQPRVYVVADDGLSSVSRRVATRADAENAYDSN